MLSKSIPGSMIEICTRNFFDELGTDVDGRWVQAALSAELTAERKWARHLGRHLDLRWLIIYLARWIRRFTQRVISPNPNLVRRLLNIEYAHLHLLKRGLDSGAPWILILEDDASCSDVGDLADGLLMLMSSLEHQAFINLSDSFTARELGITHLLSIAENVNWEGRVPRAILESKLPVTNTVCAIVYSRSLAESLLAAYNSLPQEPVLPIDWKLNQALVSMLRDSRLSDIRCLFIEPAPIVQMSMK